MRRPATIIGLATLLTVVALCAWAVEGWDLTSSEVRQAYFLGQRSGDPRLAEFLAGYVKRLPAPPSGPHVASIAFSTPYHQIVERSRLNVVGYSAQQAQKDYDAHPDRILVTTRVNLLPGDVAVLRDRGFWREFRVRLVQGERVIPADGLQGELVYQYGDFGAAQIIGFDLRAEFTTRQVERSPLRIEVITHEKQTVTAQFDLARLK